MITITSKDHPDSPLSFRQRRIRIGRDPRNDLVINSVQIHQYHAQIVQGKRIRVLSPNGGSLEVDGRSAIAEFIELPCEVTVGGVRLELREQVSLPTERLLPPPIPVRGVTVEPSKAMAGGFEEGNGPNSKSGGQLVSSNRTPAGYPSENLIGKSNRGKKLISFIFLLILAYLGFDMFQNFVGRNSATLKQISSALWKKDFSGDRATSKADDLSLTTDPFLAGAAPEFSETGASQSDAMKGIEGGVEVGRSPDSKPLLKLDREKTILELTESVDNGDNVAAVELSRRYLEGLGVPVNRGRAFSLLKSAAEAGEQSAWFPLGELYETGIGQSMEPLPNLALAAFREAISAGDSSAMSRFGYLSELQTGAKELIESWNNDREFNRAINFSPSLRNFFHLEGPIDHEQQELLESNFRTLWVQREFSITGPGKVELFDFNEIVVRQPYRFKLAYEQWNASGVGEIEVVFQNLSETHEDHDWEVISLIDSIEFEKLVPDSNCFETGQTTRNLYPLRQSVSQSDEELPPSLRARDSSRTVAIKDRFGNSYQRIPTGLEGNLVVLTDHVLGDELLLPVEFFEESLQETFYDTVGSDYMARFQSMMDTVQRDPDWSKPRAAALLAAADRGDPEAMAMIGEGFFDGLENFPFDRNKALEWFVKSARNDHPLGRYWLAKMADMKLIGVDEPTSRIYRDIFPRLVEKVADASAPPAYSRAAAEALLGVEGGTAGKREVQQLLGRAAGRGDARSWYMLAEYEAAKGGGEAIKFYMNAEEQGHVPAAKALAEYFLGEREQPEVGFRYIEKAARKGFAWAQIQLGLCKHKGIGTERDFEQAAFWLQAGALSAQSEHLPELVKMGNARLLELEKSGGEDPVFWIREFFVEELDDSPFDRDNPASPGASTSVAPVQPSAELNHSDPTKRVWRMIGGQAISGAFVRIESNAVCFRSPVGGTLKVPFHMLSKDDRAFAEKNAP